MPLGELAVMIADLSRMNREWRRTGGYMSPSKERKELKGAEKARRELDEMKRNGPGEEAAGKLHSKKELIKNLASKIRELRADGHSYESILSGLAKGGIAIKESTLKKYLNEALKPRRKKAGNAKAPAEFSPSASKAVVPPLLQPKKTTHSLTRSDGSFAVLPDEEV